MLLFWIDEGGDHVQAAARLLCAAFKVAHSSGAIRPIHCRNHFFSLLGTRLPARLLIGF
jgi:hypothetical protein